MVELSEYKIEGECSRCLKCCEAEFRDKEGRVVIGWCPDLDVEKKTCKWWGTDQMPSGCRTFPTIKAMLDRMG
jgi:Fe-S-cluster containining protein